LEAPGVQATPRNARIDVEELDHVLASIGSSAVRCIATKEHTPDGRLKIYSLRRRDDTTADQLPPAQLDQIERVDKQAITRTALLSSMKSSRHSGKSVFGP
jgi:hypothetical protein